MGKIYVQNSWTCRRKALSKHSDLLSTISEVGWSSLRAISQARNLSDLRELSPAAPNLKQERRSQRFFPLNHLSGGPTSRLPPSHKGDRTHEPTFPKGSARPQTEGETVHPSHPLLGLRIGGVVSQGWGAISGATVTPLSNSWTTGPGKAERPPEGSADPPTQSMTMLCPQTWPFSKTTHLIFRPNSPGGFSPRHWLRKQWLPLFQDGRWQPPWPGTELNRDSSMLMLEAASSRWNIWTFQVSHG